MTTLLKPEVRPAEEALGGDLPASRELVTDSALIPGVEAKAPEIGIWASPSGEDLIEAAHEAAKDLYACWDLSERIEVYKTIGADFKGEARRVLNIAAARWPEMIPMVNDLPEWKALLSADLS